MRGPRRHFTYSKVMAWVAADRMIRAVRGHSLQGPADRWEALRDQIHSEVCLRGVDRVGGHFTQAYGAPGLNARLLLIPRVGFLPPTTLGCWPRSGPFSQTWRKAGSSCAIGRSHRTTA